MNGASDDWEVDCRAVPGAALLRGVMRLPSPAAYDGAFAALREQMLGADGPYTIDVREVVLMNSSGIRALATLVLAARDAGTGLVILGRQDVLWQRKSLASLHGLHPGLMIRMDPVPSEDRPAEGYGE